MRGLSLVLILPLLALPRPADAARISLASADCGTPDLLGLTFTIQPNGLPDGGTDACPGVAVGSLVGDGGTQPLYGTSITSIGFVISNPGQIDVTNPLDVDPDSAIGADLRFIDVSNGFLLTGGSIAIVCGLPDTRDGLCIPPDLTIAAEGFAPGTVLTVISVNGISAVPEPALLALLAGGTASAWLRRRRRRR